MTCDRVFVRGEVTKRFGSISGFDTHVQQEMGAAVRELMGPTLLPMSLVSNGYVAVTWLYTAIDLALNCPEIEVRMANFVEIGLGYFTVVAPQVLLAWVVERCGPHRVASSRCAQASVAVLFLLSFLILYGIWDTMMNDPSLYSSAGVFFATVMAIVAFALARGDVLLPTSGGMLEMA